MMDYLGEHLWPGRIGHAAILVSFVFAILAAIAYSRSQRLEGTTGAGWKLLGRWSFLIHSAGTFTVILTLFLIMINRLYEYQYAWAHVSDDLPFAYIFSAFWEDQPGSFLLWAFWHVILALVLIRTAGKWEAPVLTVISVLQAFILSMLLGIYLLPASDAIKIGYNPFLLLRDTMDAPVFSRPDYLSLIQGKGLNPLLQNYWNTIHPPTLFLGFASTSVPFAFAMAGLMRRQFTEWLKPALPWALFSAAILGTGILMGSAWAYEALSFGGYWAWDPVENMSLVPWILLVAGIHAHLITRHTHQAVRSTYVFYALTLAMVLYATFLTRSGVLQDTSVHAFTELGLEWQLVIFMVAIALWFGWLFFRRFRELPVPDREEAVASREFWMFIGSLVLLFSAILITFTTSVPVFNKLADGLGWLMGRDLSNWHRTLPADPVDHHNRYQLWIAVFLCLLTGVAQFLRYGGTPSTVYFRKLLTHLLGQVSGAAVMTWLTWIWLDYAGWPFHVLAFGAWYTILANLDYLVSFLRGHLGVGASVLSHTGFGLMLVGIIASGLMKQHISTNRPAMDGLLGSNMIDRNVLLFKDTPLDIQGYTATFLGDTLVGHHRTYTITYVRKDPTGRLSDSFAVHPYVILDQDFQKQVASNPSTRHYLTRDVFSHIAGLPNELADAGKARAKEDTLRYVSLNLPVGRTVTTGDLEVSAMSWTDQGYHDGYSAESEDYVIRADIRIRDAHQTETDAHPMMLLRDGVITSFPGKADRVGVKVRLGEQAFDGYLTPEDSLSYRPVTLSEGESFDFAGYRFRLAGFDRTPDRPHYTAMDGDVAIAAIVEVIDTVRHVRIEDQQPVFLLRNGQPYNLKSYSPLTGIHFRFVRIDPDTGQITLWLALQPGFVGLPVQVATNYAREDYIVLETILFPGINLFWGGGILMMIGLALAFWRRRTQAGPS